MTIDDDDRELSARECFNEAVIDLGFKLEDRPKLARVKSSADFDSLTDEQINSVLGRLTHFTSHIIPHETDLNEVHAMMRYHHPAFNSGESIADLLLAGTDDKLERARDALEFQNRWAPRNMI